MHKIHLEPQIRDKGKYASQLQQMAYAREREIYLSVHTLIGARVDISTRFIYRYLLPDVQRHRSAVVILPIARTWAEGEAIVHDDFQKKLNLRDAYLTLIDLLSDDERQYLRSWWEITRRSNPGFDIDTLFARRRRERPLTDIMKRALNMKISFAALKVQCVRLEPGTITQLQVVKTEEGFVFLRQIQEVLASSDVALPVPLVVLLDVPVPLSESLESKLLWFLRDARQLNVIVWLHTPLVGLTKSLLSQFGNFIIFYPSRAEVAAIQKFLPLSQELRIDSLQERAIIYTPSMGLNKYTLFNLEDV